MALFFQPPTLPQGPWLTLRWKDPHTGGGDGVSVVDTCGHGGKIGGCSGGSWASEFLPIPSAATLEHLGKSRPRPAHPWPAVGGT